jgi:hypothetical protein
MSNSRKTRVTGYFGRQGVLLGLVLLALHSPAGAQTPGARPIAFEQTIQGTLSTTDRVDLQGRPTDTYTFVLTAPETFYNIIAASPTIPLKSTLARVVPGGPRSLEQTALVYKPGQVVGYFGLLNPGRYEIDVAPANLQQLTGPYTLDLFE